MRAASPQRFPESVEVFRRRLLLEAMPLPQGKQRPAAAHRSHALQVLMDGFLHGSLLTLAVCAPKRRSLFSQDAATHRESFRTFLVSRPRSQPPLEEPARDAMPVAH
jgi:hypothetical protein